MKIAVLCETFVKHFEEKTYVLVKRHFYLDLGPFLDDIGTCLEWTFESGTTFARILRISNTKFLAILSYY
jgi:hypothetical protein